MAAAMLPKFIVMKSVNHSDKGNAYYKENDGSVVVGEEDVLSMVVKIEVEQAAISEEYVHLRFCYSNRYWARSASNSFIVAESSKPEEDTSKPSCTLFEPINVDDSGVFYLSHVQSGGRVGIDSASLAFYVDDKASAEDAATGYNLSFVDWDTLVKLPGHVALKGDNGRYLKAHREDNNQYLQFESVDGHEVLSGHKVHQTTDGHVRITSDYFTLYWRYDPNWVLADLMDIFENTPNALFWPVIIDDNTIALRCAANNKFCTRLSAEGVTDCLSPTAGSITLGARFQVEELVLQRSIYDLKYRTEHSRIFHEMPYAAGMYTLTNDADEAVSMTASVTYQDETSYTFSRSFSLTAGVSTTIEADLPVIADGEIISTSSLNVSGPLHWGTPTTTITSVTVTGEVSVPAKSIVEVEYVGTRGSCDVPFSYTQEDKVSAHAEPLLTQQVDGIYTAVNCYNFHFQVTSIEPLPKHGLTTSINP